jgi:hypothetical protein
MAARIPDRAAMNAPRTPGPRGGLAQTGDLGLGAIGEALGRTGRGMQANAEKRAVDALRAVQSDYEAEYLPAAEAYDGRTEGFARDQMARFDGRLSQAAEAFGDDNDARTAFERLRPVHRAAQFEAAIRVEAQRSGQRTREATARTTTLDALNRVAGIRVAYAGQKKALLDGFDGSQAGLTDQALSALDRLTAVALADAPEATREALAVQIAAMRGDEWMALQTLETRTREVHDATTASKAADALVSAVLSDPGQYDSALKDVQGLGAEMPVILQRQMAEDTSRALTVARFEGMMSRGQWELALTELDSGTWDDRLGAEAKASLRDSATRHRAAAGFDPVSVERELARNTLQERLASHYASIQMTGEGTGVTAAEVEAVGGPVAVAALQREERTRQLAYSVTRGLAGLPAAEQLARVESLKPKGGEADFAERQAAYELAVTTMDAASRLQATDPARAIQSSDASASLWRAYATQRTPDAAQTWARDALTRQAAVGVPETQRRILPLQEAQRIATTVKNAQGPDILNALQGAAGLVGQFGGYEGQILTELTRAGLDAPTAAIIGQSGDNPVALQDYARARARGNVGLTADKRRDTRSEVVDALRPLLQTWAPLPGGRAGTDALVTGIETVAAAYVADGMSPREAARAASQTYLSSYQFQDGYRIPRGLVGREAVVAYVTPNELRGGPGARTVAALPGFSGGARRSSAPVPEAIRLGALRLTVDLIENEGASLPPAGLEPHLSDAQKQERLAGIIGSRGRWVSTLDDDGLMLVIPNPADPNGVVPVLGAGGRPIRRTWAQLLDRARLPARTPGER